MLNDKSILAIIPARGGSKRVPRKNLRLIHGKSLLERTIDAAKQSRYIDRIVVSSEDPEIIFAAKKAGADVPFIRPAELSLDTTPGTAPVIHAVENLPGYDYVLLLQVTTPLRDVDDIDNALEFCLQHNGPACVSVRDVSESPYWMYKINEHKTLESVLGVKPPSRSQDLPEITILNGAIYIAQTQWFLQHKTFLTAETLGFKMAAEKSLDIDTEADWKRYEKLITKKRTQRKIENELM